MRLLTYFILLLASCNLLSVVVPGLVTYQAGKELITAMTSQFMQLADQTADTFSQMVTDLIQTQELLITEMAQDYARQRAVLTAAFRTKSNATAHQTLGLVRDLSAQNVQQAQGVAARFAAVVDRAIGGSRDVVAHFAGRLREEVAAEVRHNFERRLRVPAEANDWLAHLYYTAHVADYPYSTVTTAAEAANDCKILDSVCFSVRRLDSDGFVATANGRTFLCRRNAVYMWRIADVTVAVNATHNATEVQRLRLGWTRHDTNPVGSRKSIADRCMSEPPDEVAFLVALSFFRKKIFFPPPPLYKLRPFPSYSRCRDRINLIPNLIRCKCSAAT